MLYNKFLSTTRIRSLQGVEALDLYFAAIARNLVLINDQAALLRVAIAETENLLRKCAADGNKEKDGLTIDLVNASKTQPDRDLL